MTAAWEWEDPLVALKEEPDPYEDESERPLRWRIHEVPAISLFPKKAVRRFHRSEAEIAHSFDSLTEEWREATAVESNLERIVMNEAYQRIIGLGPQVLPHILKDLEETLDHWFWALTAIVGEDKAIGQTSVGAAAEAWLAWARSIGLLDE
jgi:hypothetical protein